MVKITSVISRKDILISSYLYIFCYVEGQPKDVMLWSLNISVKVFWYLLHFGVHNFGASTAFLFSLHTRNFGSKFCDGNMYIPIKFSFVTFTYWCQKVLYLNAKQNSCRLFLWYKTFFDSYVLLVTCMGQFYWYITNC